MAPAVVMVVVPEAGSETVPVAETVVAMAVAMAAVPEVVMAAAPVAGMAVA